MADSPLRAKGRAMRRKLVGDAYADGLDRDLYADPVMEKYAELTQEFLFGTLWTRPGLDLKTRTLITLVSDASTFGLLLAQCFTVWLQATPEEHMDRVIAQGDFRLGIT